MMGQFIIDSNEEAFREIYEAYWYNAPANTQALYILVLRKCLKPPQLTGGGMIPLNLDSFVQILKASLSYYTVLKSSSIQEEDRSTS
ncbi:odorant receptor 59b-like [Ceratina calcarata]|uniref:Odorant receptor 59b-like n=1 Tax=Ceratina calcarata TaxID=156304 RepID=A0AAJ7S4C4_9HYME|nr:odorant receptor 59b-like [Ceratina calcarata]